MTRYAVLAALTIALGVNLYGLVVVYVIAGWRRPRTAGVWVPRDIRSKRLLGAPLAGCAIYVHWCLFLPLYAGQTVNMRDRMRAEGHEIMSLFFTHATVIGVDAHELDVTEAFLIRAFPWCRWLSFNRTRGNRA